MAVESHRAVYRAAVLVVSQKDEHVLESLALTIALAVPNDSSDREWAISRPSRGTHSRVVQEAAEVPRSIRPWAECVVRRESGGTLDRIQSGVGARNPNSSASGKFQFLDNSWRRGLSFMVRDRLVEFGMPKREANKIRRYLASKPIYQWHGYYQTIGFVEVVDGGGRHHWNGGSHSC